MIGLVGLSQFIPVLLLSLFGGQAADRYNRKHILLICQAIRFVFISVLAISPLLSTRYEISVIILCSVVFGGVNAFFPASSNALFPSLVPREVLPKAVVWNSIGIQFASILGPALAGGLLMLGESYAYGVAAFITAFGFICVLIIEVPTQVVKHGQRALSLMIEGLRYIGSNKIVLGAITLDFVVVFFAGSIALLPVFARDVLQVGEQGFGALRSAIAFGAAGVALTLSVYTIEKRIGLWMFGSVIVFGLSILVFGMSKLFWLSFIALMVHGAADMVSMYIRQSLVQLSTPDDMKGRVSSVSFIFIAGSNELGEFQSGVAARLLGPIGAVLMGGVVAIGASLVWMKVFPQLREASRFEDMEEQKLAPK
jgi:MFS family permease